MKSSKTSSTKVKAAKSESKPKAKTPAKVAAKKQVKPAAKTSIKHTSSHAMGKIIQVIGPVVDVEFPRDNVPKVYDALVMESTGLTIEVQQQIGDGVVRGRHCTVSASIT